MKGAKIGDTVYEVWQDEDTNVYKVTKYRVTGVVDVKQGKKTECYLLFTGTLDNYLPERFAFRTLKEAKIEAKRRQNLNKLTDELAANFQRCAI